MTRLIVCCDGTWNTPDQEDNGEPSPTNVFSLYSSAPEIRGTDGALEQASYYREGVGTSGNILQRLTGGALGARLSDDIKSAYKWLCDVYVEGDDVFLFGFSRGAFSVRSLATLIERCGVLDFSVDDLADDRKWARVDAAYRHYRSGSQREWQTRHPRHRDVPIRFLGVWDTVGALGIPDELYSDTFDHPEKFRFHNTRLSEKVLCARHAVSIDERRQTFAPTLWSEIPAGSDVQEVWFAGVHGDVGGSYARSGLGDITLEWMMDEAAAHGLEFRLGAEGQLGPDAQGVQHDSARGIYRLLRTGPRPVPCIAAHAETETSWRRVHPTVLERQENPPLSLLHYWPTRRLDPGDHALCVVYARELWNITGLYLEAGVTYKLEAEGEWLDASIPATPAGVRPGLNLYKLLYALSIPAERIQAARRRRGDTTPASRVARREESMPWFSLVGVIANGEGVDPASQELIPDQTFLIGDGTSVTPEKSGYLYCFANDAWNFYQNNKGSVRMTVRR